MSLLMIDVAGTELTETDKDLLANNKVGGVILFSRNYKNIEQLCQLTADIKRINGKLLIAVDHEGGRVQRFRDGFSAIPAMGQILQHSTQHLGSEGSETRLQEYASKLAKAYGFLMASEVRACGIDISFAPVLDVDDISDVIGDRGFAKDPKWVSLLAEQFILGMHDAGMKATGKHFPGHGSVKEDSHVAMPVDSRSKQHVFEHDMKVFDDMLNRNLLAGMMPAHVVYPDIDQHPVGFSPYWLQTVLRSRLGFDGVIFSDDLSMQGAALAGGYAERCQAAAKAGCDMLLLCNDRDGAIEAINHAEINEQDPKARQRIESMLSVSPMTWQDLRQNPNWQKSRGLLL